MSLTGTIVTTGAKGEQGDIGHTGGVGKDGERGHTGCQGNEGSPGCTGSVGPTGPQGCTGPACPCYALLREGNALTLPVMYSQQNTAFTTLPPENVVYIPAGQNHTSINTEGSIALLNGSDIVMNDDTNQSGVYIGIDDDNGFKIMSTGACMDITIDGGFGSTIKLEENTSIGTSKWLRVQGSGHLDLFAGGYITSRKDQNPFASPAWGTDGQVIRLEENSYRDTSSSSGDTVSTATIASFKQSTLEATNPNVTVTTASNIYVEDVVAGQNTTITDSYGVWNRGGQRIDKQVVYHTKTIDTTTYWQDKSDYCLLCQTNGPMTVNLRYCPDGQVLVVKDILGQSRTDNPITLVAQTGSTIDGQMSASCTGAYDSIKLISDGNNWWKIS